MKQITYIVFLSIAIFVACGKTQIVLLCREQKNEKITDIYLVKNRPHDPQKLRQLMYDFNKDLKESKQSVRRIFLKPHRNRFLALGDQINYLENGCEELDIMDFICRVTKYNNYGGNDTIVYYMFNE